MFDELTGQSQYYDFPSFEIALFSLLLSFVLSTVIALVYRLTYEGPTFPRHFFQAIVLSSTVSSMVIMAVGNNLAAGFGIIGAIAIIRFRTLVRDPRNIIFIFASLSVGIATGVYGYAIAISGTLIFCVVAVLLYYSSFGKNSDKVYDCTISVRTAAGKDQFMEVAGALGIRVIQERIRTGLEDTTRYAFTLKCKNLSPDVIYDKLSDQPDIVEVRISGSGEVEL